MSSADTTLPGSSQKLEEGQLAPDFALPNHRGETIRLSDYRNKKAVVLYFYPKDFTPGCTVQCSAFRENYDQILEAGAEVIGVSSDDQSTHARFAAKMNVPFQLLSDEGGKLRKAFKVPATFGLMPGRVTYVIDKQGVVRKVFSSQFKPATHVTMALSTLRTIGDI